MTSPVPTVLGSYKIEALLGAGGMGEVYKARDTRLDRTVAIKVLSGHVASDPELKRRFEHEARTVAALNHPHICALHDIGSQDGISFLVMEYLDGQTLAKRLEAGPLPLDQALTVAIEIAGALDKAHRQGIVHRDLKPSNIMLTKVGGARPGSIQAKLLDFGVAKLCAPDPQTGERFSATTRQSDPLTGPGVILGTLPYMAPEQLAGKDVDVRTDIFAFGTITYEMVTGRRAFSGDSQANVIGAIMSADPPPISSLQVLSPRSLDQIVKTALEKDPDHRWHSAGDVQRQLQAIIEASSPRSAIPMTVESRDKTQRSRPWVVVAALVAGVIVGGEQWVREPRVLSSPRPLVRFTVTPPAPDGLGISTVNGDLAISRDGARIVSRARGAEGLVIRELDQLDAVRRPELGRVFSPFVSPNGATVGFVSSTSEDNSLMRVSVLGGPPTVICRLPRGFLGFGASWGSDDTIIFGTNEPDGLWRVSAKGGEPRALTTTDAQRGEVSHQWPEILPGGDALLFTIVSADPVEPTAIAVLDLADGAYRVLVRGGSYPRYSSSGHIVYGAGGTLQAIGFDLDGLEVTTDAIPVLDDVMTKTGGAANFDLSRDGTLTYVPATGSGENGPQRTLVWVDRDGREQPLGLDPGGYLWPRMSPDGSHLAVEILGPDGGDVWIVDVARGARSVLTTGPATGQRPLWTKDGERIVFRSDRERPGFFAKGTDGRGEVEQLMAESDDAFGLSPYAWSPSGEELIFGYSAPDTGFDVGMFSTSGERSWQSLLDSPANEVSAAVSPDGAWIVYVSDETGQDEVYLERFPDLGDKEQISADGGLGPVWSADGRELFYRDLSGSRMMVVPIDTGPPLVPGNAAVAFEGAYYLSEGRRYDLAPDGRFLMIKESDTTFEDAVAAPRQIVVVEGWSDELRRIVPAP